MRHSPLARTALALALGVGAGLWARSRMTALPRSDDAPGRTAKRLHFGGYQVTGRTVTIDAPPQRIFEHWRDPLLLGRVLGDGTRVETDGECVVWVFEGESEDLRVETRLCDIREDQMLVWRSTEDAPVEIKAKIRLRPAPGDRGTEVEAHIAWRPRGGLLGHWAAKLGGTDPGTRGRQALKRLKMLLETGEIATASNRRAA